MIFRRAFARAYISRTGMTPAAGCNHLSRWLDFRCIEGLAERVIFREFYPRGLTAVDDVDEVDEVTIGVRPPMSHVAAVGNAKLARCNLVG
jgi:chromosome partitioning protein